MYATPQELNVWLGRKGMDLYSDRGQFGSDFETQARVVNSIRNAQADFCVKCMIIARFIIYGGRIQPSVKLSQSYTIGWIVHYFYVWVWTVVAVQVGAVVLVAIRAFKFPHVPENALQTMCPFPLVGNLHCHHGSVQERCFRSSCSQQFGCFRNALLEASKKAKRSSVLRYQRLLRINLSGGDCPSSAG